MATFAAIVRTAAHDALALLSPVDCAGCGLPDRSLCDSCRWALDPPLELAAVDLADQLPVLAALRYEGIVRRAILEFKQNNRTGLARALAPALSAVARRAIESAGTGVLVVPVPPGRDSLRRRGYDPLAVLARRAGIRTFPSLRMVRSGTGQKLLGVDARLQNRRGAMSASARVNGRRVVVIDDVVTTGATLAEAERALRRAGAEVIGAAALAWTPRRTGR